MDAQAFPQANEPDAVLAGVPGCQSGNIAGLARDFWLPVACEQAATANYSDPKSSALRPEILAQTWTRLPETRAGLRPGLREIRTASYEIGPRWWAASLTP